MGNCCKKNEGGYDQDSVNEFIENHDNPLGIKLTFHDFERLKVFKMIEYQLFRAFVLFCFQVLIIIIN